jgi:phytoene dehydrogenase-like protein
MVIVWEEFVAQDKLIIIGAGIAGLSAGCYARMNGYDVEIFEKHVFPGGMCTSWKRKDYTFDYCIHNLSGTSPDSDLRKMWEELGALEDTGIIDQDVFVRVEDPADNYLDWFTDLDRLEGHLKSIAPEDSRAIDDLIGAARKFIGADFFSMQLGGFWRTFKLFTKLPAVNRWSRIKMGEFSQRFQNPFLRRAFCHVMYDIPGDEVPMLAMLLFMAGFERKDLGWPIGGSQAFSQRVESRLKELGGVVNYRSEVEKILVENNHAVGIRLKDGSEHRADRVVSAADGYNTIYNMLNGRYMNETIQSYYDGVGDSSPFGLVIFLGLNEELRGQPHALTLLFDEPLNLGKITQDSLHLITFGPDTGLVPEGKSVLKIEAQANYFYWKERRDADLKAYRDEKERIVRLIIDRIEPRFPKLQDKIEVMDVSTPPTAERFTGNRYGWQAGPPKDDSAKIMRKGLSKTLPGLDNFHMVGQWASASLGVSNVAMLGRNFVKDLCKQDKKRFRVS